MSALIVVGVVWLIVAGTAVIKVRTEERVASVEGFQRQLRSFGDGPPTVPDSPRLGRPSDTSSIGRAPMIHALHGRLVPHRARQLRRILAALLLAAVATLVVAVISSSRLAWGAHLLVDNALLAYVALLVRRRDADSPRAGRRKRQPPARRSPPDPFDDEDEHSEFRVIPGEAEASRRRPSRAMAGVT